MAVKVLFMDDRAVTEHSSEAKQLFERSAFGRLLSDGRVELSYLEALFLLEKGTIVVFDGRNRELSFDDLYRRVSRKDKRLGVRYPVFRDFRRRGYVVKTAFKFGADFRVYDKGSKPGEKHARWVVFPVKESESFSWHDFSAKNRVAHSTRKNLLIAIVDDEGDCTYFEVAWVRP